MKKIIPIIIILALIILAVVLLKSEPVPVTPPVDEPAEGSQMIGFEKNGVLLKNNPGQKPNTVYLTYEEPGSPAKSVELIFTKYTLCTEDESTIDCTKLEFENGTPANVTGNPEGDTVTVVSLSMISEAIDSPGDMTEDQYINVDWESAKGFIRDCMVASVAQYHSKEVNITLKDGRQLKTQEPNIDDVFDVVEQANQKCGSIPVATE